MKTKQKKVKLKLVEAMMKRLPEITKNSQVHGGRLLPGSLKLDRLVHKTGH
jgi:hypothetical protein